LPDEFAPLSQSTGGQLVAIRYSSFGEPAERIGKHAQERSVFTNTLFDHKRPHHFAVYLAKQWHSSKF
jgi:hypothetical protein